MLRKSLVFLVAVLLPGFLAGRTPAAPLNAPPEGAKVRARLVSEHLNFAPGKRAWLAVEFAISPGWHMYWKGQNDTGLPPQLEFELPADFKVGEVLWPAPERHVSPGDLLDSIVHEQLTLLIPIDVPVNAKPGSARIGVKAEWLVCQESCILEDAALEITLPVRLTTPAAESDPKSSGLFASARDRLPLKFPKENSPAKLEWRGGTLTIDAPGATELVFHPEDGGVALESPFSDTAAKSSKLQIRLKQPIKPDQRLLGVLEIHKTGKKPEYYTVSIPQPAQPKPG